jgi:hypothetical protein
LKYEKPTKPELEITIAVVFQVELIFRISDKLIRRKAKKELRNKEFKYRKTVKSLSNWFWVLKPDALAIKVIT